MNSTLTGAEPRYCLKKAAVLIWFLGSVAGLPQGQVLFNNRVLTSVIAPVYSVEPSDPSVVLQGNTPAGLPAGIQNYGGALLAGNGFTAQLFGGPTNTTAENLRPLLPATGFQTGNVAGFVVAPLNAVSVGDVPEAVQARLQLRAWENRGGTISNWLQVLADPTIARGQSRPFISQPLGGAYFTPVNLAGLESFNLATGAASPVCLRINFQPDGMSAPPGYLADVGLPYGDRGNGFSYGWSEDQASRAGFENAQNSPDARYASCIQMDTNSLWRIALSNGCYDVHVAAGTPLDLDGVYRIAVNGVLTVQGTPVSGNNWVEGAALVEVVDGALAISSAPGGFNNRLCFIDIAPVPAPFLTGPVPFDASTDGFRLEFDASLVAKFEVEATTNLSAWLALGLATNTSDTHFVFGDTAPANLAQRFYRAHVLVPPPPVLVYSNDFETAAGPEWSANSLDTTPVGGRQFLGQFGAATTSLRLTNLPAHTKATIALDLFILRTWDGNSAADGPDTWELNVAGGPVLLHTTFLGSTTNAVLNQAYPGPFPGGSFAAQTGAAETNTLGYTPGGDAVYHLSYTFPHGAATITFNFIGATTEASIKESWGLDNVTVHVQNDPY